VPICIDIENTLFAVCDGNRYGVNCANTCSCVGIGANHCDPVSGCVCNAGWTGSSCESEIDECLSTSPSCTASNQECVNTIGSYQCHCKTGFENATGTCQSKTLPFVYFIELYLVYNNYNNN